MPLSGSRPGVIEAGGVALIAMATVEGLSLPGVLPGVTTPSGVALALCTFIRSSSSDTLGEALPLRGESSLGDLRGVIILPRGVSFR